MTQLLRVHPDNPQLRLIRQAADVLRNDGVIIYPTDSTYALGCQPGSAAAVARIRRIRKLPPAHNLTLVCRDLSELANYARVDNTAFRLIKSFTPGPYTFLLPATKLVPKAMLHPKRKTIGLRVPENPVLQELLNEMDGPLLNTTLILPDEEEPMLDPDDMLEALDRDVDLMIESGYCGLEQTTVIDLTGQNPEVTRLGKGDPSPLEAP